MSNHSLSTQVASLRQKIREQKAKLTMTRRQRRSQSEVAAAAEAQAQQWETRGYEQFARGLYLLAAGLAGSPLILSGVADRDGVVRIDLGPTLTALVGVERLREVYLRSINDVPEGPGKADRAQLVTALEAQLLNTERQEERLIEQSELTDSPIARRPDANPAVVLEWNE